jgi:hypothetical protein
MKREPTPIVPKATYIGVIYSPAELVAALKAAAMQSRPAARRGDNCNAR